MQNNNKNFFTLIGLISLSLMFSAPFMVSYHKLPEANYYNQVLAFLFGAVSLLVFLKPDVSKVGISPTVFAPLILSFVLLVQWFSGIGVSWQEPALAAMYLVWAMLLMLVVLQLKEVYTQERIVLFLAYALLIGGLLNVLVVFMQLIGADGFFWTFPRIGKKYTGNLAQVNLLTDYLSLSLVSMIYLHVKGHMKLSAVCIFIPLYFVALSLSGSRMSWLFLILITVSFYYLGRGSVERSWQKKSKAILLLPVLYGLVQLTLPYVLEPFSHGGSALIPPAPVERVVAFATDHSKRLDLISEGLGIFSHYPVLGVGWGQYVWYDLLFADTHSDHSGYVTHTHNLFVQLMAETGVFGFLVVFVATIYWLRRLVKQPKSIEGWWLLLIGGIIFVHSMLEYPLWHAHFLGVFVVVVALVDKRIELNTIKPALQSAVSVVALFGIIYLIGLTTYQYGKIEYWVNYYPKLSKQQRLDMLKQMSAMHQNTLMVEPLHAVLTRAYSLLPRAQAPLKAKIARYESLLRYSQSKEDVYRYVLLLAVDGQTDNAIAFLRRAYTRQPAYAEEFKGQLQKAVHSGNPSAKALLEELAGLQNKKVD